MGPASPEYQMMRTYLDWILELPWDHGHRGSARPDRSAPRARRGSLRSRQGQGAHRRVPGRAQAEGRHEGPDPVLRRPARRRQDLARPVDRARDAAQVRAHLARRRPRRSRDSRASPHLHRVDARPHHPGAQAGGIGQPRVHARRARQGQRSAIRATRRRRCSRCSTRRRTTRSAITTSRSRIDLSKVLFIATANQIGPVHPALRDRMEIVWLSGYTEEEKVNIARRYLIPRQLTEHGLPVGSVTITDAALRARHRRVHARGGRPQSRTADRHDRAQDCGARRDRRGPGRHGGRAGEIESYLGPARFKQEIAFRTSRPGVATGVAWTETGGDVLFIEASLLPGGKRPVHPDGSARRGHAGIGARRGQPHPRQRACARHRAELPRASRSARACAGRAPFRRTARPPA